MWIMIAVGVLLYVVAVVIVQTLGLRNVVPRQLFILAIFAACAHPVKALAVRRIGLRREWL